MATFRPDPKGMRELVSDAEMGRAMEQVAREVGLPAFQAAAPVGPTGEYRRNVHVESHRSEDGRAGAALVLTPDADDDPNAPVSITFGTVDTPEHHALQVAREAMERG